jgi:hypothetical protein
MVVGGTYIAVGFGLGAIVSSGHSQFEQSQPRASSSTHEYQPKLP